MYFDIWMQLNWFHLIGECFNDNLMMIGTIFSYFRDNEFIIKIVHKKIA